MKSELPKTFDIAQQWRQTRFNPLRSLTPDRLAAALDAHASGWLRDAALIFETIEQREAIVRAVMTKRRAAVARRSWQVVTPDPNHPDAAAHKETLESFYYNLTVTDATDLNVRTGMSGLIRQMMDAVSVTQRGGVLRPQGAAPGSRIARGLKRRFREVSNRDSGVGIDQKTPDFRSISAPTAFRIINSLRTCIISFADYS